MWEPVYWLVDPLDGTKEFLKQNGEYTVNIARVENGVPVLGVVYVPSRDVLYTAAAGKGAFRNAIRLPCEPSAANAPLRAVVN